MQIRENQQKDYDDWKNNNSDEYGRAIFQYAEKWANLMELHLEAGSSISECASDTSHQADTDGITGFMYGAAVSILSEVWVYGETLRRWHNKDVQIHDEGDKANENGGVLNPALISIG
jgi:hypothetical protein